MDNMWFEVTMPGNFYEGMVGKCVGGTKKTMILEFKLSESLGGVQKVQFFNEQLLYNGKF